MSLPETGVTLVAENERGFFAALSRSTGAVDSFQKGAQRASVGTIALGTSIGNLITGGLSMIAQTATTAGSALTSFVGQGINEAAALEAQMSGIAAVTGANSEEMEQLNALIMDLGLNPNLTVSTVEAAQAIEMLGKNGVSVTDIIDGMALSTVQLANSTGADFATAADLATDTMSLFRNQGIEMGDAVNGITAVVNSSKFGINDYALALANGGATAAALGVELDDFNALLTGISPSFTSGATAGTAMKNMLLRLSPATNKAEDEMKALGLITEDGSNVFFDAEGNMKSMSQIAGILSGSLGGLSEQQKAQTLKTIFGNDAMEAVLATMAAGTPLYEDAATAAAELGLSFDEAAAFIEAGGNQVALASLQMQKVDAAESAATRVDNFAGAMDILSGIVEGVRIQIGDKFLPVLTDMAQDISDFVSSNSEPFIQFFETAANFIGGFFELLMQGETPLFSFLGALEGIGVDGDQLNQIREIGIAIGEFIEKVSTFVGEHKDEFIGALQGIGAVLAGAAIVAGITAVVTAIGTILSPIGLIIAAAALLGAAWNSNWGGIQEKTQAVIDFITPYVNNGIEAIKTFWAENGDSILLKASEIWEAIKDAVSASLEFIRDDIVTPIAEAIAAIWEEHGESIKDFISKAWEVIKKAISTAVDNIKLIIEAFTAFITGDLDTFNKKVNKIWSNTWDLVLAFIEEFFPGALLKFSTFILDIIKLFKETDWGAVGTAIADGIAEGIKTGATAIGESAKAAAQAALTAAKNLLGIESPSKVFMEIGGNIGEGMAMGIDATAGRVGASAAGLGQAAAQPMTASPAQIMNRNTTISNRTVNFTGNFSNQPQITDRDALIRTMATL